MPSPHFVALLRGINVGGHNVLPMADLRAALEASGFDDVRTYIQSGNVVVRPTDDESDEGALADAVASVIRTAFAIDVPVVVRSLDDLARIADAHPDADGEVPPKWLHVFLLDRPADPSNAPDAGRFGDDRWALDGREVYATYPAGSGRSKLTVDVVERSFGVVATARNVSTLAAIVALGRRA